jgi:hypothetical protein
MRAAIIAMGRRGVVLVSSQTMVVFRMLVVVVSMRVQQ